MLTLTAGDMRLDIAADIGGSVSRWSHGDTDLMRRAPPGANHPLQMACFPLLPYANRLAGGRLAFEGRRAVIAPNMAGERHPLHGEGWLGPWLVEASDSRTARLSFEPPLGDWPWTYEAQQTFTLSEDSLSISLCLRNRADTPAPVGLGFHPYFPNSGLARLTAPVAGVWLCDAERLPVQSVQGSPLADWPGGAPLRGDDLVDHCHTGWGGEALIELTPGGTAIRLTARPPLTFLHIYAPQAEPYFCVEPVCHRPDAFNAADPLGQGTQVLAAGAKLCVEMTCTLLRTASS